MGILTLEPEAWSVPLRSTQRHASYMWTHSLAPHGFCLLWLLMILLLLREKHSDLMPCELVSHVPLITDSVYLLTARYIRQCRLTTVPCLPVLQHQSLSFYSEGSDKGWLFTEWQGIAFMPISKSAQFNNLGNPRSRVYKCSFYDCHRNTDILEM